MLLTKLLLVEVRDVLRRHMSKKLVDDVLAQRWSGLGGDRIPVFVRTFPNPVSIVSLCVHFAFSETTAPFKLSDEDRQRPRVYFW